VGLLFHSTVKLVPASFVAILRGINDEAALALADDHYQWVWDVSINRKRRDLRFWTKELEDRKVVSNLSLDQVIEQIVPRRDLVPGQFCGLCNWEVTDLLHISRRHMINLRKELGSPRRADGKVWTRRQALERFFRERWLGAV
jgi:hypothetical protein